MKKSQVLRKLREALANAEQAKKRAFPQDRVQWEGVKQGLAFAIELVEKS